MPLVDLHLHTTASFDSSLKASDLVARAAAIGLTHVAITDHERVDGALELRDRADGLSVIVGEEIRTADGDLIGLFVNEVIPNGLTPEETSAAIRAQGGIVGLPHGFDPYRPSIAVHLDRVEQQERLARLVDYVEVYNARVREERANERAAEFARAFGLPMVAVSDGHSASDVGLASIRVSGPLEEASDLARSLHRTVELVVRSPLPAGRSITQQLRRLFGPPSR